MPDEDALEYLGARGLRGQGLTGKGVVVGQVDSALSAAVANGPLAGRIKAAKGVAGVDPLNAGSATHASMMVGLSVPSGASLVLGAFTGSADDGGFDSDIIALAYWMIDEVGIDVLLLEVQGRGAAVSYPDLLRHARSKGVLEVMPAGNYGDAVAHYPAKASTFAVTNYDRKTDRINSSSSYGDYVFAASLGTYVNLYNPDGSVLEDYPHGGTSASSAFATGIAASLLVDPSNGSKRPPEQVRHYLEKTARRTGASPLFEGAGVLNAGAATNAIRRERPECPKKEFKAPEIDYVYDAELQRFV